MASLQVPTFDGTATLAVEVDGSGPPVLLVHGITDNRSLFAPLVERLAPRHTVVRFDLRGHGESTPRPVVLAMVASVVLLGYFELRARAFSPAQAEARLAALNARIRPHFLFNSLNAVLSLIRARPQQAEAALESLSDLFRAAMRDPGEMISLADEIALGKQYFELERLRLGERLAVHWQIGAVSLDLPIPPLMLQPLLENAVYHGIEPSPEGGTVSVSITQRGDELRIAIANPNAGRSQHAAGNHIAVANIRERLSLYYDLEARLEIEAGEHFYEVRIFLPCRTPNR